MYEDENNLYHYSYRKGDEQNPQRPDRHEELRRGPVG